MSGIKTVQTMLDFPTSTCRQCDPTAAKGAPPCDSCWDALQGRIAALMAAPEVVAIIARIANLTEGDGHNLHDAALANFRRYRSEQSEATRRVRVACGDNWRDLLSVKSRVYTVAQAAGLEFFAMVAAEDAAYAYVAGDLLTDEERRLFTKPWTDVLGDPLSR